VTPLVLPALARAAAGPHGRLVRGRRSRVVHVARVPRLTATGRLPRGARPVCGRLLRAQRLDSATAGGLRLPVCRSCTRLLLRGDATVDVGSVLTVDEIREWLATAATSTEVHAATMAALRHGSLLGTEIGAAKRRVGTIQTRDPRDLPAPRRRSEGRRTAWWQDPAVAS
jgi:hypothetical protein